MEVSELKELTHMLLNLLEAAQSMPEGPERRSVIKTIGDFQRDLAILIQRHQEDFHGRAC